MGAKFKGTGVALVTPFNQKKELDLDSLGKLLLHTGELDYWVVNGTTGESPTLNEVERSKVLQYIADSNPNNLPVMFGIGGNNTQAVLNQIKITDFSHINAILSVCPYYNKPSQQGLIKHYWLIADHSPVPVYIYNVPGRTSCNIEASTILKLAGHHNIHGVKEASPDRQQWLEIGQEKPEDFDLISGDDVSTIDIIKCGGCGVISVLANAFPGLISNMVNQALSQQWYEAESTLDLLRPINPLMYKESNPVGIKKVLNLMGISEPYVRLPLVEATEQLTAAISATIPPKTELSKKP
ncbi:MAG: 4-hydroxy-tetrahydrodipicolinate synthase [Cyclobacteriaceae bacterium]|nr:MAG: 4-hydroxy-tetrahydrodipicolinate synthase [Cyclobacteriaceae bacterium]